MGYTHYWEIEQPQRIGSFALSVIRKEVMGAYKQGVVQRECNDHGEPIVTDTLIAFNGAGANGHETFYFDILDPYRTDSDKHFDFCKTARKTYDRLVMRVLIALKYDLKHKLHVRSDGDFTIEWERERVYMAQTYQMHTYPSGELVV